MRNLSFRPAGPSPSAVEAVIHRLKTPGDRSGMMYTVSDGAAESVIQGVFTRHRSNSRRVTLVSVSKHYVLQTRAGVGNHI